MIYFQFKFIANSDPHRNLSNHLQTQARTNVDMSTWCRHVHMRPHCFILIKACSCRLELAYFVGKISKIRLVRKNDVALAYYGSCWLQVMGSWPGSSQPLGDWVKALVWFGVAYMAYVLSYFWFGGGIKLVCWVCPPSPQLASLVLANSNFLILGCFWHYCEKVHVVQSLS